MGKAKNNKRNRRIYQLFWRSKNNKDDTSLEYDVAKVAMISQAKLAVKLAEHLAQHIKTIDSTELQDDNKKIQLQEEISDMSETAKNLLEKTCDRLTATSID